MLHMNTFEAPDATPYPFRPEYIMPEGQFAADQTITAQEYDEQPAPQEAVRTDLEITATDAGDDDAQSSQQYWAPQESAPAAEPRAAETELPPPAEPVTAGDAPQTEAQSEAPGAELSENTPEANPPVDTALPKAEVLEQFKKWMDGETVPSEATPVGELPPLSEDELAIMADVDFSYEELSPVEMRNLRDIASTQNKTGLTDEQLKILGKLDDAFIAIVKQDLAANGLSDEIAEMHHTLRVGVFDSNDVQDWHVDNFGYACVRYVASLGDCGSTQFATGEVDRSQTNIMGDLWPDVSAIGQQSSHGTGVVSRFLANQTVHRTPVTPGFRVFITASSKGFRSDGRELLLGELG
jgi:hypothetical protein